MQKISTRRNSEKNTSNTIRYLLNILIMVKKMENKPKRKTHTSSAVKRRYNEKNYKNFRAAIKPDLYEQIDEYLKQEGISRPEFLLRAIEKMKGEKQ